MNLPHLWKGLVAGHCEQGPKSCEIGSQENKADQIKEACLQSHKKEKSVSREWIQQMQHANSTLVLVIALQ